MKKLKGMKSNFSSLENKKLEDLKSIRGGGTHNVRSNVDVGENNVEYDVYESPGGKRLYRMTVYDAG